jgi:hypothetical protein
MCAMVQREKILLPSLKQPRASLPIEKDTSSPRKPLSGIITG